MSELFQWEPPSFIPRDAWDAFVEMRKAKGSRAPWTKGARDIAVRNLKAMDDQGEPIGDVLWKCVEHGWSGVEWGLREVKRSTSMVAPEVMRRPIQQVAPSRTMQGLMALQGGKR